MNRYKITIIFFLFLKSLSFCISTEEDLYILGLNSFLKRDFGEAIRNWEKVIEINPDNQLAKKYIERATFLYKETEDYFTKGKELFDKKDLTNAAILFQDTLLLNPGHKEAIRYLSLCLSTFKEQSKLEAIEETELQSLLFLQNNEFRKATALYKMLTMLDPNKTSYKLRLAESERNLKLVDRVEELRVHIETAYDFFNRGRYTASVMEWKKVLSIDPFNPKAIEGLKKAKDALQQKEQQERIGLLLAQGIEEFDQKHYARARNTFQKVLKLDPQNKTAKDYISRIEKILKKESDERLAKEESYRYLRQGQRSYTNMQYDKALTEFERALILYEKNEDAARWITLTKEKKDEYDRMKKEQDLAEAQRILENAITLYDAHEFIRSKNLFVKVLELDPENETAKKYLQILEEIVNLEEESTVSIDSPYYSWYKRMISTGKDKLEKQQLQEALNLFEEVIKVFPLNREAGILRLKVMSRLNPSRYRFLVDERFNTAKRLLEEKKFNAARNELLTIKEIYPDYPQLTEYLEKTTPLPTENLKEIERLYNTGVLHYNEGRLEDAKKVWQQALNIDPSPETNPFFGRISANLEKIRKKESFASTSKQPATISELSSKEKTIQRHYYLGVAFYTEGNYEKAIEEWQKILKIDPRNVQALNSIERVKKRLAYSQ